MIDKFISCMKEQGWIVERNEKQRFCLLEPMKSRYTGYPESWVEFEECQIVAGFFKDFMKKIISKKIHL